MNIESIICKVEQELFPLLVDWTSGPVLDFTRALFIIALVCFVASCIEAIINYIRDDETRQSYIRYAVLGVIMIFSSIVTFGLRSELKKHYNSVRDEYFSKYPEAQVIVDDLRFELQKTNGRIKAFRLKQQLYSNDVEYNEMMKELNAPKETK